jgi:uncharacterized protein
VTLAELSLPFGLGLASSLHCVQMCGPLVLSYSLPAGRDWRTHAFYNAGRITTYAVLGAVAGVLGSVFKMAGHLVGIEQTASLIAGILMIVTGVLIAGVLPSRGLVRIGNRFSITSILSRSVGGLLTSKRPISKLWLGLLLGFIPCGLVYAALLRALAAEGPAGGALAMIAFGAGTSFALFAVGWFSSFIGAKLGRWSNQIAAISIVLMGVLLLWHGLKPVTVGPACHH